MKKILSLILIAIHSGCGYPPLLDQNRRKDFIEMPYKLQRDYLVENDSLVIKVSAQAGIPKNGKAKKLHLLFSTIRLTILKNLCADTLRINLDEKNKVIISDGKNPFSGDPRIILDTSSSTLLMYKDKVMLAQGGYKSESIFYKFHYSKDLSFDYNNQDIKINWQNIETANGHLIPVNDISGSFRKE